MASPTSAVDPSIGSSTTAAPALSSSSPRRLPRYFPTFHADCKAVAEQFFACFEAHSAMKHARDTTSAMEGLNKCLPQLDAYESCQEQAIRKADQKKQRAWWKFW